MRGVEKDKMAQICMFNSKWLTSCGRGVMMSRGLFVGLGLTKACTEFHQPTQNLPPTTHVFSESLGGATDSL